MVWNNNLWLQTNTLILKNSWNKSPKISSVAYPKLAIVILSKFPTNFWKNINLKIIRN